MLSTLCKLKDGLFVSLDVQSNNVIMFPFNQVNIKSIILNDLFHCVDKLGMQSNPAALQ